MDAIANRQLQTALLLTPQHTTGHNSHTMHVQSHDLKRSSMTAYSSPGRALRFQRPHGDAVVELLADVVIDDRVYSTVSGTRHEAQCGATRDGGYLGHILWLQVLQRCAAITDQAAYHFHWQTKRCMRLQGPSANFILLAEAHDMLEKNKLICTDCST